TRNWNRVTGRFVVAFSADSTAPLGGGSGGFSQTTGCALDSGETPSSFQARTVTLLAPTSSGTRVETRQPSPTRSRTRSYARGLGRPPSWLTPSAWTRRSAVHDSTRAETAAKVWPAILSTATSATLGGRRYSTVTGPTRDGSRFHRLASSIAMGFVPGW